MLALKKLRTTLRARSEYFDYRTRTLVLSFFGFGTLVPPLLPHPKARNRGLHPKQPGPRRHGPGLHRQFLKFSNPDHQWENDILRASAAIRNCHDEMLTYFLMRLAATNLLSQLKHETGKVLYKHECKLVENNVHWNIQFASNTLYVERDQSRSIMRDHENVYITVKERNDLIVSPRSRVTIISRNDERDNGLPPHEMMDLIEEVD